MSLAITVQLPRASTEFNFFTITFFFDILVEDTVSARVKARGRLSGIAETERAITDKNISLPGMFLAYKRSVIIKPTTIIKNAICFESLFTLIVRGDSSSSI